MTVTITPQTVTAAFAFVGAVVGLTLYFAKVVQWFDTYKRRGKALVELEHKHDDDMKAIHKELSIITQGQLACLKGLQEKGCNGPVTKAIEVLEDYLNIAAHDQ